MASIVKRKDSYLIRVSCGYDVNGRKITQSTTWHPDPKKTARTNEKALQRFAMEFEDKCKGLQQSSRLKFQALAEEWFKNYAEKQLKERTLERYLQLKERTYKAFGHMWLDKITPRVVQNFINDLGKDGVNQRTGGKLSPKTIKHYVSFVSTIFDYAVKMRVINDNPCNYVSTPKIPHEEMGTYTIEEVQQILSLLPTAPIKYRVFITLAIYTGFRRGELLGLEWKDIDFDTNIISIRRNALYSARIGSYTDSPKTKKSARSLKMQDEVMELLKEYKEEQLLQQSRVGDQWQTTDRLFTTWNGKPMNGTAPYSWFKKFCDKNGFRFLNLHSFRHFNASLMIYCGVNMKEVSASMGHSQTSTTYEIYGHTFDIINARAMDAVATPLKITESKNNTIKKQA